jgi:hypothetical protein
MQCKLIFLTTFSFLFYLCNATDPDSWPQGYYEALHTDTLPVIDGIGDDNCWFRAVWKPIDQTWIGQAYSSDDYSGRYKVLWTAERLYLLIEITDDSLRLQDTSISDVCSNIYNYDCTEVFIDENHSRDVNYANSHKAFAYHMDTSGHVCYANGSFGWERLDDHINYKIKRVSTNVYHYEYEIKIFDDSFVYGGENTPVTLTEGKLMGWSLAYNDNDMGNTRQNMIGSKFVPGNSDFERNVSYYNASVFGDLKLVNDYSTSFLKKVNSDPFQYLVKQDGKRISIIFTTPVSNNMKIQLIDISGREYLRYAFGKSQDDNEKILNTEGLPDGLYILRISDNERHSEHKLVL